MAETPGQSHASDNAVQTSCNLAHLPFLTIPPHLRLTTMHANLPYCFYLSSIPKAAVYTACSQLHSCQLRAISCACINGRLTAQLVAPEGPVSVSPVRVSFCVPQFTLGNIGLASPLCVFIGFTPALDAESEVAIRVLDLQAIKSDVGIMLVTSPACNRTLGRECKISNGKIL